jgi:hypothetical protein
MNPRDIEDYKCSSCKAKWAPQFFGYAKRTGARLKTCNYCRQIQAARAEVRREMRLLESVPEVTPEPVLWDAAAEMNTYAENEPVSYYPYTETVSSSESPRGEPITVDVPASESEEDYLTSNPSSSSAAAVSQRIYYGEPEPEPPADFGSDTD